MPSGSHQSGPVDSAPSGILRGHHAWQHISSKFRTIVSLSLSGVGKHLVQLLTILSASFPSKTRHMADLCSELVKSWRIHRTLDSKLQGIHLEMTGDVDEDGYRCEKFHHRLVAYAETLLRPCRYMRSSVTEIVGGSMERSEEDLPTRYLTFCDPRCSVEQVSSSSDHTETGETGGADALPTSDDRHCLPDCRLSDNRTHRHQEG